MNIKKNKRPLTKEGIYYSPENNQTYLIENPRGKPSIQIDDFFVASYGNNCELWADKSIVYIGEL